MLCIRVERFQTSLNFLLPLPEIGSILYGSQGFRMYVLNIFKIEIRGPAILL